ncbi:MAG TPA: hypothetical protein VMB80_16820 [Candidatus Acidoferrum sp.]|nr:hypothetical protein [Candidatus Acidoferrum sp.]
MGRLASIRNRLDNFFSSREVDRDPRLKMICAGLLFYYFMTFFDWWQKAVSLSTRGNETFDYAPAVIFQHCRWLIFMNWDQTKIYLYALGMLALLGLFSLFYLRSSLTALCLLAVLCVNKAYFYLSDFRLFANFHHFHLFFTLVFLFSQSKLRFFRGALAVGYLMSAVVKISPSWLLGEYFNSMPGKLPLLPKAGWVVTAASVGVVVLEFLGPLCWFTRINWLRRLSFVLFILFHLYSGVVVGFWYTALMLPLVLAAFVRFDRPLQAGYHFSRRHLIPFGLFAFVMFGGLYHYCLPGDVRLTNEGRYLGFFMFDANRQVRFEARIQKGNKKWVVQVFRPFPTSESVMEGGALVEITCKEFQDGHLVNMFPVFRPIEDDGEVILNPLFFAKADYRVAGNPYLYYFYARELVRRCHPDCVSLRLDVQLDGHPDVVRLLDIPDFAKLNPHYRFFAHNDWILLPGTNSPPEYRWP